MTDAPAKKTVCVVDDDDVVRESLSVLLSRQYEVIEFASGVDYLARGAGMAPGCLLLDVHMPGMTGIELVKILRAQGNSVPVVLMTGRRDAAITAEAGTLGILAVLDKPASHTTLYEALEKALAVPPGAGAP
jgi:two-component system response regulator FixJ